MYAMPVPMLPLAPPVNNLEFYASYVEYNRSFLMEIIGVIFVVIIFIKYSIKSPLTAPLSLNMGNIIPHMLTFKVGALLFDFHGYIQFSSGFMAAYFPWLNFTFGNALSDSRDESPVPYSVFYINMNIAPIYSLALRFFSTFLHSVKYSTGSIPMSPPTSGEIGFS